MVTFYFYDLETSGVSARSSRIMQFGGQRVDQNFNPIGEPHNLYIKLTPDILPQPDAVMVTGITPQFTLEKGITEVEFLKIFNQDIATPETIFVGFNSVRFDDEFMRFTLYRNFYDAYEWQYKDDKSKWDLLDVVRMTRALRPEGISWPTENSKNVNRLELLANVNKLSHTSAHDALSDVTASIELAKLIHAKQPKLFDYLLNIRDKKKVAQFVNSSKPFVYTSGKYSGENHHTTVVIKIADHPKKPGALVYDLRHDPAQFFSMSTKELAQALQYNPDPDALKLPVKTMTFNRCPAIAPLNVLDKSSQKNINIDLSKVDQNLKALNSDKTFAQKIVEAFETNEKQQQVKYQKTTDIDEKLYEGFIDSYDKKIMDRVHTTSANELTIKNFNFKDKRLSELLPLYKARNYPENLSPQELTFWHDHCKEKLIEGDPSQAEKYFERLGELIELHNADSKKKYLLEELQIYGQNLLLDAGYQG